jgi:dolichol-phosphate mannosyltransferase
MISIIIPTYNEVGNIGLLIQTINKTLKNLYTYEIIIIDDNSPDYTASEVRKFSRRDHKVRLFVRKNQRGLGAAILYGLKKAKGKIIVGIDADFNHPPELIPKLIVGLKKADLVVASRFISGGGMQNKWRYFFTLIFNLFLHKVLGFPTMDNMSGFYAIKRKKLNTLPLKEIYRGYGEYHLRLLCYAQKSKLKIKEIPVFYKKRLHGKSKSNLASMFVSYTYVAIILRFYKKKKKIS